MPRITLVGYRGTGKTTVAALLGELLGCGVDDADEILETRVGCTIASLVRERGESVFRDEESIVLAQLLNQCSGVLSTGGGAVLRGENRELLRQRGRPVVWLTAPAAVVHARIVSDPSTPQRRPSLADPAGRPAGDLMAEVAAALAAREPLYRECADAVFDTAADPPHVVAARIAAWLAEGPPHGEGRAGAAADRPPFPPGPATESRAR